MFPDNDGDKSQSDGRAAEQSVDAGNRIQRIAATNAAFHVLKEDGVTLVLCNRKDLHHDKTATKTVKDRNRLKEAVDP